MSDFNWNDLVIITATESEVLDLVTVLDILSRQNPGDDQLQKAIKIIELWNRSAKRLKVPARKTKISIRRKMQTE